LLISKISRIFAADFEEVGLFMPEKKQKIQDKTEKKGHWKEYLGKYLLDISKYVMTGVVIASLIQDVSESRYLIYVVGLCIAFAALAVGLLLTDKKKGE